MQLPAAFSANGSAQYIGDSERGLHNRRKTDATFPKPRLIGGRLRWLREELDAWLRAQPVAESQPEPPQLARSTKRSFITPKPEAWPPPPSAAERVTTASRRRKAIPAGASSRAADACGE